MNQITTRQNTSLEALGEGLSILGQRQATIPVGGKIRSGIKVLTKAAAANEVALNIYNKGVAAGATFGAIEKRIMEECKLERSPLTPKNVPYFTVRRADFAMPEVADLILDRYGEVRDGQDGVHLYRFPVIFPMDSWAAVMPHALRAYSRSGLMYWSEYGSDGTRYCKTRADVPVDPSAKRAVRVFGGRPVVLRPDNGGLCEPERCPQYQQRACNFSGALLFFIPGIPGSSAISLATNSIYSMQQARQTLEMVAFLRGGRISGTQDGKPIFYVTKKSEEVSMLDPETGQPKKAKQWLIKLEADIAMDRVFTEAEEPRQIADGASAAALLGGDVIDMDDDDGRAF
jgi:hypothetical protein